MSNEKKIRELMARLVSMSPEPPPYPEGTLMARHREKKTWRPALVFATAAAVVAVLAVPMLLFGGGGDPVVAGSSTTTSTTVPDSSTTRATETSTTTTVETTTTEPAEATTWTGVVYLYQEPENSNPGSPALIPLPIEVVDPSGRLGEDSFFTEALDAIGEDLPAEMFNAIPGDVQLVGLSEEDGLVIADMNQAFLDVSLGTSGEIAALNQLIYNLTTTQPDAGVRFTVDGEPVDVFGSHGLELSEPLDRETFVEFRAPIFLTEPVISTESGFLVEGVSNVFEAAVNIAVLDGDGEVVYDEFVTASCGTGCWGDFATEIDGDLIVPGESSIQVLSYSAEDGSPMHVITVPIPESEVWTYTIGG
ncbi:MAG: Gmad2 immunoglobulin-like domain-containing protein [Actinomycetota bacterium]